VSQPSAPQPDARKAMIARMFAAYDQEVVDRQVTDFLAIVGHEIPLEALAAGIEDACRENVRDRAPGPGHVRMAALAHVRAAAPRSLPAPRWPKDREPIVRIADYLAALGVSSLAGLLRLTPEQRAAGHAAFEERVANEEVEVRWREVPSATAPAESPRARAMHEARGSDALTKAERKEADDDGIPGRFDAVWARRARAYERAGLVGSAPWWAALNDLTNDAVFGRFAKGVRLGWANCVRKNRRVTSEDFD
jgi:hypothetical protein